MENLNDVARAKVERMIANAAPTVMGTVERLLAEGKIANDFITEVGSNNRGTNPEMSFSANGHVAIHLPKGDFELHDNAVRQLGERMNVPQGYLLDLARGSEWKRELAAEVLNKHSLWTPKDRVLVRSVGTQVRAVLSDHYRRLNSTDLVQGFLETLEQQGAVLTDGRMDDTRVWFESIYPQGIEFPTEKNGTLLMFFGARLMTSDYGDGALQMRSFMMQGVCLNGMVRESVLRQVHLGGRLPDNIHFSESTYRHDTLATAGAIRDITRSLFSRETFLNRGQEVLNAAGHDVNMEKELKALTASSKLGKGEADQVGKILMDGKAEDGVTGEPTLWKLVNGITAYARTAEPRRRLDLQEIAGELMNRANPAKQQ